MAIPIIRLTGPPLSTQIEQACRTSGFFYLSPERGLTGAQVEQAFKLAQAFFALPMAVKLQVERSSQTNCGYVPLGAEALNPNRPGDHKEALNLGWANLGQDALWPNELRQFQADLTPFYQDCIQQVALPLLRMLALSLGLPQAFFTQRHGQNFFLRLLHYPPLESENLGSENLDENLASTETLCALRAGEHTDYGTLTLLFQSEDGLQIYHNGNWQLAAARPELILVNLGDALQRWTNDQYRSTPHRVVQFQPGSRYSMALFCDPDPEVEIACLPTCCSEANPARYHPIRYQDYLQDRFAATYERQGRV